MKNPYAVRVANADEFAASRQVWNDLVQCMRYPTPFATWEWVYTWWEQLGRESLALPFFVYRGERLCGILPVFGARFAAPYPKMLALDYGGGEDLYADHLDLICAPNETEAIGLALLAFLVHEYRGWDVLRIPNVAEDGGLRKVFWREAQGLKVEWSQRSIAPYITGGQSYEQFLGRLSRNERYKLRNRSRKLLEGEGFTYVSFTREERAPALAALLRLHEQRAAEKGITSSFAKPSVQVFHQALLERMPWEQVMLRGLRRGDEVIAVFYGFRVAQRTFYFQLGHDPAWSKVSPGLVLITETIRESFDGAGVEYNFLQGDEAFKRTWTHSSRTLLQFRLYNRTSAGWRLYAQETAKAVLKSAVRRCVPRVRIGAQSAQYSGGV